MKVETMSNNTVDAAATKIASLAVTELGVGRVVTTIWQLADTSFAETVQWGKDEADFRQISRHAAMVFAARPHVKKYAAPQPSRAFTITTKNNSAMADKIRALAEQNGEQPHHFVARKFHEMIAGMAQQQVA
jgi:hypothetical protein